jgi:putative serine protease PepD
MPITDDSVVPGSTAARPPVTPWPPATPGGQAGPGAPAGPDTGRLPPWMPPPDQGPGGPGGTRRGSDGPGRRPPVGIGRLLAIGLLAVALVGAGVGIGELRDDQAASAQAGIPPTVAAPGPVRAEASGDEPVEAVAKALAPAVVQLETGDGLGSGVIYDGAGYILTAAHVVSGVDQVNVRMADGTRLTGKVVGADEASDIAVVKVSTSKKLPTATLAVGVAPQVGQLAVAIGSPFGLEQTVTSGIVSAVNRTLVNPDGQTISNVLQTDAPINPGNSGGALADREGRVIGINSAIRASSGGGNVGVGFAVPIDTAARVAEAIVRGQPVRTGYLGITGSDAPDGAGAVVGSIESGSPAASAGLRIGDRITRFDAQPVTGMADVIARVRAAAPGSSVTLEIVRDGQVKQIPLRLTTR